MARLEQPAHDGELMRQGFLPARWGAAIAAAFALATVLAHDARAQDPVPGPPDDNYVYGQVLLGGANIAPPEQTIIAFVNGISCGWDQTRVATDHPDNPPADVGKTVYAVAVRRDGTGPAQKPGCGTGGDLIRFYLPETRRFATQTAVFTTGDPASTNKRANLSMDVDLANALTIPLIASDKTN
ncbi:MAG: hypothetical protein Kow0010_25330 [Dehalococcoidia bacterium]